MERFFYNRPFLVGLLLLIASLLILLLVYRWYEGKSRKQTLPTVNQLTQEIEDLELSLQDVVNQSQNKDMEIDMRDQLLEEKNIELAFLMDKFEKVAEINVSREQEIAELKTKLKASRSMLKEATMALQSERNNLGLIYRVQIGILENEELPAFPIDAQTFLVEEAFPYNKYVLGSFREYEASLEFRDLIRKLGVRDAWVVAYIDGERIEMSEVQMEEVISLR
ncbi:MAG: hypothetical protein AAF696_16235 [Bacteroidota bacterium]